MGSTPAAPAGPCGVRYLRLPVLDRQLHRDPQPLPVARGLSDVIAHLLGGLRGDTWRSHRARVKAESPSAAPGFSSVCGTAERLFSRTEQHRPGAPQGTLPTTLGTYFIPPPPQDSINFPRDSLILPSRTRFPLRSGHASSLSSQATLAPDLPPPCPRPPKAPSPVRTNPRGPILGASADVAPTSPPVQRR